MYYDMTKILTCRKIQNFELSKFEVDNNNLRAIIHDNIPIGNYVRLAHNGHCVMSNTPMELDTNAEFVTNAHGDVLIAGLGIGLIVLPIQDKTDVQTITIVEKHIEVIQLVQNQLPLNSKVKIILQDIFDDPFEKHVKFDCIYFDIWNEVSNDIYRTEMMKLKHMYKKHLKFKKDSPNRFIKCWSEEDIKRMRRMYYEK